MKKESPVFDPAAAATTSRTGFLYLSSTASFTMVSEKIRETILSLWRDKDFSGSFAGLSTFGNALRTEKNINISNNELLQILRSDADFLLETRKIKKTFPRRKMNVHGVFSLWQADFAQMFKFGNFVGFLLCVDVFSRKLFCRSVPSKTAEDMRNAFKSIFDECKDKPNKLETDQGGEFIGNKTFFKEQNVFFKIKTGRNKASYAEHGILLVKRRLFRLLRTLLTRDWPKYLENIVQNLNNTPNPAIGGLKPNEIEHRTDTPLIDKKIGFHPDVSFEMQMKNQREYEKNKKPSSLQVGNYVYVDFPPSSFEKSFDTKNFQLFIVQKIDAGKNPVLYQVKDLRGKKVPGFFYREQLLKTERPRKGQYFRVEDILAEKEKNNKKHYLVKFMHYPKEYNKWLPEENVKL